MISLVGRDEATVDSDTTVRRSSTPPSGAGRQHASGSDEDSPIPEYGSADYFMALEVELDRSKHQVNQLTSLARLEWMKIIFLGVIELTFIGVLLLGIYATMYRHSEAGLYSPLLNYAGVFILFLLVEGLSIMSSSFALIRKIKHLTGRLVFAMSAGQSEIRKA
jgi:hypothetical protein